jgi:tRNA splicing endonuclease
VIEEAVCPLYRVEAAAEHSTIRKAVAYVAFVKRGWTVLTDSSRI